MFIGLMSGTSMDGIDAALVVFGNGRPGIQATCSEPYPDALHEKMVAALGLEDPRHTGLAALDNAVGEVFARAVNRLLEEAGIERARIRAIGSHGQTIRHEPEAPVPYSLQIGNPEIIAARTQIDVVADFRTADIAAGGQGAPLAPAFHKAVFAAPTENRVVLNIGGIANITILPAARPEIVTGFDTGPGNTLMDAWARTHLGTVMDAHGQWAAGGRINQHLLDALLADPYFRVTPPKSTGREYFNMDWLAAHAQAHELPVRDVQATLCELTVRSIATAIAAHAPATGRLLVCGGGVHNTHLLRRLEQALPQMNVESTGMHGLDPDWVEAAAFAWLARQTIEGKPGNLPAVTGATRPVVLGRLFRKR